MLDVPAGGARAASMPASPAQPWHLHRAGWGGSSRPSIGSGSGMGLVGMAVGEAGPGRRVGVLAPLGRPLLSSVARKASG